METTESPLDVLSRAAVMLQQNVLPPSYDEARSMSQQQQQKSKLPRKYKTLTSDVPVVNSTSVLTYDQSSSNNSGKWKREKKHQQKTTAVASTCESTISDYKPNNKYSRCNSTENNAEPLDMSKRPPSKDRGEPPSYFQSIMNSNYTRQQSVVLESCDESSTDAKETMCDQVINEHFRRSLGQDYVNVFSVNKKQDSQIRSNQNSAKEVENSETSKQTTNGRISPSPLSVDDHFAKALGDTWIKLQERKTQQSNQNGRSNN